jgi:hypothetical protein
LSNLSLRVLTAGSSGAAAAAGAAGFALSAILFSLKSQAEEPKKNKKLKKRISHYRSLNEAAADKILKYRADYHNNPPAAVAFMPVIASTSGRLHSEFIRLLFFEVHWETDRFFSTSGVQPV